MIGSGDHRGYAGIHHSIGTIGQYGGVHTTALLTTCTGSTCIGIITITHIAHIAQRTTITHIIHQCAHA